MKKIMFNDKYGLTKAVLEGRKTMTRRVIKTPKKMEGKDVYGFAVAKRPGSDEWIEVMALDEDEGMINNILPKYKVGEVVSVAQAYDDIVSTELYADELLVDKLHLEDTPGWSNKMFVRADLMPHQIRITNVRVERLQDISDEDCLREGILAGDIEPKMYGFQNGKHKKSYFTPKEAFAALIDKISGKGTFESNPWVFVYEFEHVK